MIVEIRLAGDRFVTSTAAARTLHSFSFGGHYDPANLSFGALLAHNEETVQPGPGYERHAHRDVELVSWVLEGRLRHEDTSGSVAVTAPGEVQVLSAGTGVEHAERSAGDGPVHFLQMWLRTDSTGPPAFTRRPVDLVPGRFTPVASGFPGDESAARIRQAHARLLVARLRPGETVGLPAAAFVHVFVARGAVRLAGRAEPASQPGCVEAGSVEAGDALRITDCAGAAVLARQDTELLVWEMHE